MAPVIRHPIGLFRLRIYGFGISISISSMSRSPPLQGAHWIPHQTLQMPSEAHFFSADSLKFWSIALLGRSGRGLELVLGSDVGAD